MSPMLRALFVFAFCGHPLVSAALAAEPVAKLTVPEAIGDLSGNVEPLDAKQIRESRTAAHIEAVSLFAAGRVAEQKQDQATALRLYQRALRRDPGVPAVLRSIVTVAFGMDRSTEAVRYALLLAEQDPTDAVLLQRLAIHLTEQGSFERAVKLYEKAAELSNNQKPDSAKVLLWLDLGRLSYLTKNYPQAADNFAKVIEALQDPKKFNLEDDVAKAIVSEKAQTYQLFAEAFLEAGRIEPAEAAFSEADKAKSSRGALDFNLARLDVARKDYVAALDKLEKAFEQRLSEQGIAPYQLLVDTLNGLGKEGDLLDRLEKLSEQDARNLPLNFFLADQYAKAGQLDKAEILYNQILKLRSERPPVEVYQGLLTLYRQQDKPRDLFRTLGDAVGRAGSLEALGDAAKVITDDKELVKRLVEIAVQRHQQQQSSGAKPDFGENLAGGLLALTEKSYDESEPLLNAAIEADKSKADQVLLSWGLDLLLASQYDKAAAVFQRGLDQKLLPQDNPGVYFYLAGALEMSGKTDAALAAADKAAELAKDSPRFASRRAWVLYHAKRIDEAKKAYLELVDRFDPQRDSAEAREVVHDTRLALSNIAVQQSNLAEAEEWVEQVLDEFPEDIGAQNDLGYLWADQGKYLEVARQMIERAVAGEPDNKAYRDSLGWVLYRLGDYQGAVNELEKAIDAEDPDGVVLDHYGDALKKLGQRDKAAAAWTQAVQVLEKDGEQDKVMEVQKKLANVSME